MFDQPHHPMAVQPYIAEAMLRRRDYGFTASVQGLAFRPTTETELYAVDRSQYLTRLVLDPVNQRWVVKLSLRIADNVYFRNGLFEFSPDGKRILVANYRYIFVVDANNFNIIFYFSPRPAFSWAAWGPKAGCIITCDSGGRVGKWSVTGVLLRRQKQSFGLCYSYVSLSPCGKYVAAAPRMDIIDIVDVETLKVLVRCKPKMRVNKVVWVMITPNSSLQPDTLPSPPSCPATQDAGRTPRNVRSAIPSGTDKRFYYTLVSFSKDGATDTFDLKPWVGDFAEEKKVADKTKASETETKKGEICEPGDSILPYAGGAISTDGSVAVGYRSSIYAQFRLVNNDKECTLSTKGDDVNNGMGKNTMRKEDAVDESAVRTDRQSISPAPTSSSSTAPPLHSSSHTALSSHTTPAAETSVLGLQSPSPHLPCLDLNSTPSLSSRVHSNSTASTEPTRHSDSSFDARLPTHTLGNASPYASRCTLLPSPSSSSSSTPRLPVSSTPVPTFPLHAAVVAN